MSNKLSIPRLQQDKQGFSGRRTSRACDSCRQRKTKCDGRTPICSRCLAHGLAFCVYSDAKGIEKQALKLAQRKVDQYESLLQDILGELGESAAKKVTQVLSGSGGEVSERSHGAPSSVSSLSSVGSLDRIDVVNEDLNRSEESRATGYMGKDSEITWMQRLESHAKSRHEEINSPGLSEHYHLPFDDSVSSINYRLDYQSMSTPDAKDAYSLPPRVLADLLFEIYLERVQISLPFIREDLFMEQYQRFVEYQMNPGQKWLAILNMIFAIGCAYYRLFGTIMDREADESLFLARARTLNISENVLYGSNDLQQVHG
ncbi:hypothetical protein N7540_013131 [Penicillium herquei]|nr:hypothetical protein N7540_013131 [Penicillium herquei]